MLPPCPIPLYGAAKVHGEEVTRNMRSYEAVLIFRPELDEEQYNTTVEKYTGLVANNGGSVENVDKWGKRRFAYEINDLRDGYYVVLNFKGEPAVAHELDRILKISEEVLRHLIVRPEE